MSTFRLRSGFAILTPYAGIATVGDIRYRSIPFGLCCLEAFPQDLYFPLFLQQQGRLCGILST